MHYSTLVAVNLPPIQEDLNGNKQAKYSQHPELKERLLATKDIFLEEDNDWGDTEWGVCNGYGKNRLGKILMLVRRDLQAGYSERSEWDAKT